MNNCRGSLCEPTLDRGAIYDYRTVIDREVLSEEKDTVPQPLLTLVPKGATTISDTNTVVRESGEWRYFVGMHGNYFRPISNTAK